LGTGPSNPTKKVELTAPQITYAAEVFNELTFTSFIGQFWALPFLVYIYKVDIDKINTWTAWDVITVLLSYPSGKTQY
jgi:hypothetical protein